MKNDKRIHKEPEIERLRRLELSGMVLTRIVKDKKKYTRKTKHKGRKK